MRRKQLIISFAVVAMLLTQGCSLSRAKDLEVQLADTQSQNQALRSELATANSTIVKLEDEIERAQSELATANSTITKLRSDLRRIQTDPQKAEVEIVFETNPVLPVDKFWSWFTVLKEKNGVEAYVSTVTMKIYGPTQELVQEKKYNGSQLISNGTIPAFSSKRFGSGFPMQASRSYVILVVTGADKNRHPFEVTSKVLNLVFE